jgi:hypothetical protein
MSDTTPNLPPHYYLDNFRFLLDWVSRQYADLLGEEEQDFIARFNHLVHDSQLAHHSQCLLVRLLGRKGPHFRADKLRYDEIEQLENCASNLIDNQLLQVDTLLSLDELAGLLTKPELLELFPELRPYKNERKETLVLLLANTYREAQHWSQWTNHRWGELYTVGLQDITARLLLLFFGNAYQDLSEFVLQDLGLFRYENYLIDYQHRIFKSRDEVLQYQQLLLLRELLGRAQTLDDLQQLVRLMPQAYDSPAMERRRARLCNQLAYELERTGEHDLALQLYQQIDLPPARERRIRLLEKAGHHEQAWRLLNELLQTPANEEELQIGERMAPRLAKKAGSTFAKKSPVTVTEHRLLLEQLQDESGNYLSVEEIVQHHFDQPDALCFYVENHLLNGLFGLWLWPEMFRSIDGAFANPFQAAPLDLYQEDFIHRRPGITQLWQLLDSDGHHQHIREYWQLKQGITNHFVSWALLDETLLHLALDCIPAAHLKRIFERLLFDIKNNRSGFPDLIQFFPAQKTYRMIEIKGPGDRVQDNQKRWLDYFAAHQIPAEVCYVSWQ